jgi:PIN domain nuclease of toxin-antitoxin system
LGSFPVKLLLDTHIWLWGALDSHRLTHRVEKALADPANELWLSSVSVWELTQLCRKGRFRGPEEMSLWVGKTMQQLRLTESPITIEVALAIPSISFSHGDPADHFLVASAKVFDFTLVTADEQLMHLPGIHVLANR